MPGAVDDLEPGAADVLMEDEPVVHGEHLVLPSPYYQGRLPQLARLAAIAGDEALERRQQAGIVGQEALEELLVPSGRVGQRAIGLRDHRAEVDPREVAAHVADELVVDHDAGGVDQRDAPDEREVRQPDRDAHLAAQRVADQVHALHARLAYELHDRAGVGVDGVVVLQAHRAAVPGEVDRHHPAPPGRLDEHLTEVPDRPVQSVDEEPRGGRYLSRRRRGAAVGGRGPGVAGRRRGQSGIDVDEPEDEPVEPERADRGVQLCGEALHALRRGELQPAALADRRRPRATDRQDRRRDREGAAGHGRRQAPRSA